MKLTEIYDEIPPSGQITIQQILAECRKSKSTEKFAMDFVKNNILPVVAKVNPENQHLQASLVSGIPIDLDEQNIDWETVFDMLSAVRPGFVSRILWPFLQPLFGFIIGVKIPQGVAKNREQRLIYGKWFTIASLMYFSEVSTNVNRGI